MNGRELFLHEPWVFDNTHYWGWFQWKTHFASWLACCYNKSDPRKILFRIQQFSFILWFKQLMIVFFEDLMFCGLIADIMQDYGGCRPKWSKNISCFRKKEGEQLCQLSAGEEMLVDASNNVSLISLLTPILLFLSWMKQFSIFVICSVVSWITW